MSYLKSLSSFGSCSSAEHFAIKNSEERKIAKAPGWQRLESIEKEGRLYVYVPKSPTTTIPYNHSQILMHLFSGDDSFPPLDSILMHFPCFKILVCHLANSPNSSSFVASRGQIYQLITVTPHFSGAYNRVAYRTVTSQLRMVLLIDLVQRSILLRQSKEWVSGPY